MEQYDTPWSLIVLNANGSEHPWHATIENVIKGGRLPYHTIMPLGLLKRWLKRGDLKVLADWWGMFAMLLEYTLNRWAECAEVIDPSGKVKIHLVQNDLEASVGSLADHLARHSKTQALSETFKSIPSCVINSILKDAVVAGVCSLDQTVKAAIDYLARDEGRVLLRLCNQVVGLTLSNQDVSYVELTTLREGHTSSVLRVAVYHNGVPKPTLFGLNVARDLTTASRDLHFNHQHLRRWAALDPGRVAEVYNAGHGHFLWFGQERHVLILAVRWLERANELHVVPMPDAAYHARFQVINSFRQGVYFTPEVDSEVQSDEMSDYLWKQIVVLRTRLAQFDPETELIKAPHLELNHGDVVVQVEDGEFHTAVVACSPECWQGPISVWPYEVALSSACDDINPGRRLYWGKPAMAILSAYHALNESKIARRLVDGQSIADRMITAARNIALDVVFEKMFSQGYDSTTTNLLRETRVVIESSPLFRNIPTN